MRARVPCARLLPTRAGARMRRGRFGGRRNDSPHQARPGRRDHEGMRLTLPASCPGLSRAPTPCRGRTAPGGGRSRPVRPAARSGVGGRDKPGQDGGTMKGTSLTLPASCPGLSRAPTPCRGRTAPGGGRSRPVRPAARSGVGGRDKPGQDGGTMKGTSLTPSRVMPGPVPGTRAVPRPDRSRRGPQPFGAPCGPVRPGWPGQARPGRRNHEGDEPHALPRHARACPGHPRRAAAGPVPEGAAAVRCALRPGPAWVAGTGPAMTAER